MKKVTLSYKHERYLIFYLYVLLKNIMKHSKSVFIK